MDTARIRQLLDKREAIDSEIQELVAGVPKKAVTCSGCGETGHTARSCPKKQPTLGSLTNGATPPAS